MPLQLSKKWLESIKMMLKEQTNIVIEPCNVLSSPKILKDILLFTFSPIIEASGSAIASIRKEIVI